MNKWIVIALVGAAGLLYWFVWRKKPAKTTTDAAPVAEEEAAPSIGGGGGFMLAGDSPAIDNPGIGATGNTNPSPGIIQPPPITNTIITGFRPSMLHSPQPQPGVGGGAPPNPNAVPSNLAPATNPRWGYLHGTQSPLNPQL